MNKFMFLLLCIGLCSAKGWFEYEQDEIENFMKGVFENASLEAKKIVDEAWREKESLLSSAREEEQKILSDARLKASSIISEATKDKEKQIAETTLKLKLQLSNGKAKADQLVQTAEKDVEKFHSQTGTQAETCAMYAKATVFSTTVAVISFGYCLFYWNRWNAVIKRAK